MRTYRGSCHCQAVQIEVDVAGTVSLAECNCSICERVGYLHLIVPQSQFRLISGAEQLTSYRFNTRVAEHLFCRVCGVKAFYVPRSHPDQVSVNARCLADNVWRQMEIVPFDGQNWEDNVQRLR